MVFSYISSFFNYGFNEIVEPKPEQDIDKFSMVDSNSLIWDINNLSITELENKYRCSFVFLTNLLKDAGCKIYSIERQPYHLLKIPYKYI
jgi:hypothetical protein